MAADSTTDEVATWQVIAGSARGAAHRASGLPNQDAVASQDGPGGVAVAIADGHGHIRHFRSADGAALAVEVACRVAGEAAAGLAADTTGNKEAERAGQELARAVVSDWRSAVADQLGVRPYTVEEQFILDRSADTPVVPYGSTLLVAVIAARWLVCAQIGDGDMLAVRPDGSSFAPVAGDDRLDGRRTTSLCQPDALASFRTGAHDLRQVPLAALLLATDGYGNAQADEPWQPSVGRDLAELAACRDRHWFGQEVPGWAERCASAEADDRVGTMLAERSDAVDDLFLHRIAADIGVHSDVEPMQVGHELREQRQRRDAAVGDDERPPEALPGEMLCDELARTRAEENRGRESEAVNGHRALAPWILPLPICTKRSSRMSFGHWATLMSGRMTQVSVRRYSGSSGRSPCMRRSASPTSCCRRARSGSMRIASMIWSSLGFE